jgi:type III secretory pathway lipoprotein EscJ
MMMMMMMIIYTCCPCNVFGTAILMIHVKQTHANGMLFAHFTLNEQVEAVRVWRGGEGKRLRMEESASY